MSWELRHISVSVCVNPRFPHNKLAVISKDVFFDIPASVREDLGVIYDYYASSVVKMHHIYQQDWTLI